MKILLIHKFHYMLGGTETFHYNLAEALTAAGHEVIFFSMYDERNIPCAQDKYFVSNVDYSPIIKMNNFLPINQEYKAYYEHDNYILYFGRYAREKGVLTILKAYAKMHCDEKLVLVGKGSEEDSVDYIMAVPASENHLLGIISVLIEKTIGKGRIFSGTYYILLGALIARTRIFAKAKIILPVLVGTFLAAAFLNLFLMKIIMSVMFFMLVLMCNCSGDGRKFRRTSTVMYYIPIRNLVSNQEYQRPLSENHIRKALEEFDVYQINPVKVSRRDGINYVFDGQHTIEIIASESGSRDTPVWCMIYDDLKYKEEAHIFADQQKHVKALSSFETFKAHIEADDPKQKMIEAIVQSYGLAITSTKAKNGISAVSTLERIYDKYGQAVLDRTLRLAAATWEGENNSFSGNILMGIARIVVAYGDTVRDDVFKDHVGRVSVKAIIRAAKERRPGALGYSEAMIIEYNKKSKFRLSLKTLYGGKAMSGEDDFGEE